MSQTKIVFLYSEIAGYFMACANALVQKADVMLVHWPKNSEAPFNFAIDDRIKMIDKSKFSLSEIEKLVFDFNPDTIVCSGWMDKDYLKILKKLDRKVQKVLSLDNHWNGNLKQRIATMISPFYLKRIFTHAWVPGVKQERYAEKLGFKGAISKGFYCADTILFNEKYNSTFTRKKEKLPKRFLYVARYVEHKGIFEMWKAFTELQEEFPNDWELWCLGTGEEWENKVESEKIKHFGFVQPDEMDKYIAATSVYILPSKFEPWGVSTQEFAICGFPLLLSDKIGSSEKFLQGNGIQFEAGNISEIKNAMLRIIQMSDADIIEMGEKSHSIGNSHQVQDWVDTLLKIK
ncbi:glycosyltransferase family 4 protein [Crocinitomix catalasitica]|uniref:glycosyltransferase family 4 protein n=1 Tax=Crocinitomix catalasitica TaxID=184607 RepID=UPI000559F1C0|nr:glycosyltransferase [Crocinitomix catalasitica]